MIPAACNLEKTKPQAIKSEIERRMVLFCHFWFANVLIATMVPAAFNLEKTKPWAI